MTARQILVVDDEIGIRELLRDILQDERSEERRVGKEWRSRTAYEM